MTIIGHKDASGDGTVASGGAVLSVLPATTAGAMPAYGTAGTDTLPVGTVVRLVGMVVTETFVGASITAITMTSGDATPGAAIYLAATQIGGTGGTNIVYARGTIATNV